MGTFFKCRNSWNRKNGTILDVYEEKGEWLYITYGDSPHLPVAYVHKSQVKKRNNKFSY